MVSSHLPGIGQFVFRSAQFCSFRSRHTNLTLPFTLMSAFLLKNAWIKVRYITLICTNTKQTHQTNVRKSPSHVDCKQPYVKMHRAGKPLEQKQVSKAWYHWWFRKRGNKVHKVNLAFLPEVTCEQFSSYLTGNTHRLHYKEELVIFFFRKYQCLSCASLEVHKRNMWTGC